MNILNHTRRLMCLVACCLLFPGCAHTWKIQVQPVNYPAGQKVDARVQLLITDEFRSTSWSAMISPMDKAAIALGEQLVRQSERLANAVFSDVTTANAASSPATKPPRAVLTPKVVSFVRTQPPTIFGDQTTTLQIEWRLTAPSGDTLWVNTVKGESTTKMGSNLEKSAGLQIQAAIDQCFKAAYQSMTSSPEVRRLGQTEGRL